MCVMSPYWVNGTVTFSWLCIGLQPLLKPLEEQSAPVSQKPCLSAGKDKISQEALTKIENFRCLGVKKTKYKPILFFFFSFVQCSLMENVFMRLYSPYDVILNYQNENVVASWIQCTNKYFFFLKFLYLISSYTEWTCHHVKLASQPSALPGSLERTWDCIIKKKKKVRY